MEGAAEKVENQSGRVNHRRRDGRGVFTERWATAVGLLRIEVVAKDAL